MLSRLRGGALLLKLGVTHFLTDMDTFNYLCRDGVIAILQIIGLSSLEWEFFILRDHLIIFS